MLVFIASFEALLTVSQPVVIAQNPLDLKRGIRFDPSNKINLLGNQTSEELKVIKATIKN